MKPAPFDYVRPGTIAEAVSAAHEYGSDAVFLAGGQSLIAMLNMRLSTPRVLIDISRLPGSNYIHSSGADVMIGCATRQAELGRWPDLDTRAPLLAQALPWVGHLQTRSRGTVCGSIAHADPSSELPLCLAILDGEVEFASQRGRRTVRARDFFVGTLQTLREPTELITEVRVPDIRGGAGTAFNEVAVRHGDFAIIAAGVVADESKITIGIGGGADRPEVREWPNLDGMALDDALNELAWSLDFRDDQHATAQYRRHLVRTLGRRTIEEAVACRT